jgi:nucleoside-diphosphate-sugar epimerase
MLEDVARAMRFSIHNRQKMGGQIYNLGNDSINMSKLDLMKKISEITSAAYTINKDRTDPDQRNYMVSSQKLYSLGYEPIYNLEIGIRELVNFYKLLTEDDFKRSRNY